MNEGDGFEAADEEHNFEARARREHRTSHESASEFEELPVGYTCKVYHSPDSMIIRGLGYLMALNGVGAAGGAMLSLQDELTKLYAILEAAEMNNAVPSEFLMATNMPLPVRAPPLQMPSAAHTLLTSAQLRRTL